MMRPEERLIAAFHERADIPALACTFEDCIQYLDCAAWPKAPPVLDEFRDLLVERGYVFRPGVVRVSMRRDGVAPHHNIAAEHSGLDVGEWSEVEIRGEANRRRYIRVVYRGVVVAMVPPDMRNRTGAAIQESA